MENKNVVNDTQQAVVAPEVAVSEDGGAVSTDTGVANRTQTAEQNSGFRKMRLENERYKKELESVRGKSNVYLNKLVENKMKEDLDTIKAIDPEVESLDSIGDNFIKLIENGIDAITAYYAVKRATDGKVGQKSPESIGMVGVPRVHKSEFYSSRELDRLTARDLENPAIYKKAMESLKRL